MVKKIDLPSPLSARDIIHHLQKHVENEIFEVPLFWENYFAGEIFRAVHKERQRYADYLEALDKEVEKYLG